MNERAAYSSYGMGCADDVGSSSCAEQQACNAEGECADPLFAAEGAVCDAGLNPYSPVGGAADDTECARDACDGKGGCAGNLLIAAGTPCGDAGGECTVQDTCNGAGACTDNGFFAATTPCGDVGTDCIVPDTCNGTGYCIDNGFVPASSACAPDEDACTSDRCDGSGTCIHPPIPLAPVCRWLVVGDSVRTRVGAKLGGSVCSDSGDVGDTTRLAGAGSWASVADSGTALTVRPAAVVENGRVVTGGGCVAGKQGAQIFGTGSTGPICCADGNVELPGGNPANVIDACGLDPLVGDCREAKAGIASDVALLDSLEWTQSLGSVNLDPASTRTLAVEAGLNVIDIDSLKLQRNSALVLDAQGHADAVVIVRVASGIRASRKVDFRLAGGLLPENVLLYAQGGGCTLNEGVHGAGTLFCPAGNVRLRQDSAWTGAIAGGRSTDIGWNTELTHVPFLGLAQ